MSEKTKKGLLIGGGIAVAAGVIAICLAVGVQPGIEKATKIVTLTGAAFAAVGALILGILGAKSK